MISTLIYNKQQMESGRIRVLIKSDLFKLNAIVNVNDDKLETFLHKQNIDIIRRYLIGYAKCRISAFKSKHIYSDTLIPQLQNLLHHLQIYTPASVRAFYNFVLKWEDLLIICLPPVHNKSHDKIDAVLSSCKRHLGYE